MATTILPVGLEGRRIGIIAAGLTAGSMSGIISWSSLSLGMLEGDEVLDGDKCVGGGDPTGRGGRGRGQLYRFDPDDEDTFEPQKRDVFGNVGGLEDKKTQYDDIRASAVTNLDVTISLLPGGSSTQYGEMTISLALKRRRHRRTNKTTSDKSTRQAPTVAPAMMAELVLQKWLILVNRQDSVAF